METFKDYDLKEHIKLDVEWNSYTDGYDSAVSDKKRAIASEEVVVVTHNPYKVPESKLFQIWEIGYEEGAVA
jgi:hypothetical protein